MSTPSAPPSVVPGQHSEVRVRPGGPADVDDLCRIFADVLAAGESYALDDSTTRDDAIAYWIHDAGPWFVAERAGRVVGACMIHPNQPGRGSHVANAAFVVDAAARGTRVGDRLVDRALAAAREAGYRSMQFNLVVATNHAAIRLYRAKGFSIVGREPEAFRRGDGSYVDAFVFHRFLDRPVLAGPTPYDLASWDTELATSHRGRRPHR